VACPVDPWYFLVDIPIFGPFSNRGKPSAEFS
jgi:hypothetical protein